MAKWCLHLILGLEIQVTMVHTLSSSALNSCQDTAEMLEILINDICYLMYDRMMVQDRKCPILILKTLQREVQAKITQEKSTFLALEYSITVLTYYILCNTAV